MPQGLLDRCGTADSIGSFRRAARQRYADGLLAFESGVRERRTGAVYLFGYAVEMTVKAAVFRAQDDDDGRKLEVNFKHVIQLAGQAGVSDKPKDLHDVSWWAKLLILARATWPTTKPMPAGDAGQVRQRAAEVATLWHPRMRYHGNVAYPHEVERVRIHAEWFVERFESL